MISKYVKENMKWDVKTKEDNYEKSKIGTRKMIQSKLTENKKHEDNSVKIILQKCCMNGVQTLGLQNRTLCLFLSSYDKTKF